MKKFLTIISIIVVMTAMFTGCKAEKNEVTQDETVITINDIKVSKSEVLLYLITMQQNYEAYYQMYGQDVSQLYADSTVGTELKGYAIESATMDNISALIAKEKGITLTDEEITEFQESAKTFYESMDSALIEKYGFTLESAQNVIEKYAIKNKLVESLDKYFETDTDEINTELDTQAAADIQLSNILKYGEEGAATKVRARHILISTLDETGNPLSEEDKAAARTKAEEALAIALAGEDFTALVTEYSEDPGSVNTGGEYTFGRGEMVAEFEETAYSLEPGEISDIVETSYGYHIIKLEEKDIKPTEEEIQANLNYKNQYIFNVIYEQLKEQYEVVVNNEVWDKVVVEQLAPSAAEDTTPEDTTSEDTTPDETTPDEESSDQD